MLRVTVQAIHGQAGPAGRPNPAITPTLGNAAPTTSAATAALASRRDFTHAFHAACRNALASMARKTVRGKGAGPGGWGGGASTHFSHGRETVRGVPLPCHGRA